MYSLAVLPKDGEDEREEEGQEAKPDHGEDPPLPDVPLGLAGLGEHDHAGHDEAVDDHDKVGLEDKLALEPRG